MAVRVTWVSAALLVAAMGAAPAAADFSMQQDAFVRGFNNFAQANGKASRLTLKVTDTGKMGKFIYDLHGCATVSGLSRDTNQVIDTLLVTATTCTLPGKVDDFLLLAKYLARLALQGHPCAQLMTPSRRHSKPSTRPHKKQTIVVGPLKIAIEFSDVIGWVMRVQ